MQDTLIYLTFWPIQLSRYKDLQTLRNNGTEKLLNMQSFYTFCDGSSPSMTFSCFRDSGARLNGFEDNLTFTSKVCFFNSLIRHSWFMFTFSTLASPKDSLHLWPVSYYALFQGWLLLSQPPGCLWPLTTFTT
jgi:hypothetical protein